MNKAQLLLELESMPQVDAILLEQYLGETAGIKNYKISVRVKKNNTTHNRSFVIEVTNEGLGNEVATYRERVPFTQDQITDVYIDILENYVYNTLNAIAYKKVTYHEGEKWMEVDIFTETIAGQKGTWSRIVVYQDGVITHLTVE